MKTLIAGSNTNNSLAEFTDNNIIDNEAASTSNVANPNARWPIREKLFLISFVLVHGDSDWPFISSQLNRWITGAAANTNSSSNHIKSASVSTTSLTVNEANKKTIAVRIYKIIINSTLLMQIN
jgi:hypothetical protein